MREMTCISCPVGCHLKVEKEGDQYLVTGNKCKRGEIYAIKEMTNPSRTVCSTVHIEGGFLKSLPVKTDRPVPKGKIFSVMDAINQVQIKAPVKIGQIIIHHVAGTKSNIVATRSMEEI